MRFIILLGCLVLCQGAPVSDMQRSHNYHRHKRATEPGCRDNPPAGSRQIFHTGKIYTVEGSNWDTTPKNSMVVEDGKIIYIGTKTTAVTYFRGWSVDCKIKLWGDVVLPGIHDVHQHPLEAALAAPCVFNINDELASVVTKIASSGCGTEYTAGTDWVLGWGHSIENVELYLRQNPALTPRQLLDTVVPDRPAALMEATSHSLWVNSKALEAVGITGSTSIAGGVILTEGGEPNGILLENAGNYVMHRALASSTALDNAYLAGLKAFMSRLNKNGITSICDARVYWQREHHETWGKIEADGDLTVRASLALWAAPELDDAAQIAHLKSLYSDSVGTSGLLRRNMVKVYSDGLIESTTAALIQPYSNTVDFSIGDVGMNYFTQGRLANYIDQLQDSGFDFLIHTIGDRGVREALNAIEQERAAGSRHRLTHVETVTPADIARFQPLGVIADFQVAGDWTLPQNRDYLSWFIGQARADASMPVKSMHNSGAKVTLSSDYDVASLNPFIAMDHALNRGTEAVTIKEAIEMYTINGAYVMRQEDVTGSLKVGKDADFIILSEQVVNYPNRLKSTFLWETYLQGRRVYSR